MIRIRCSVLVFVRLNNARTTNLLLVKWIDENIMKYYIWNERIGSSGCRNIIRQDYRMSTSRIENAIFGRRGFDQILFRLNEHQTSDLVLVNRVIGT